MSKKMSLYENMPGLPGYNLLIEKDAGNPILIAMGGREDLQKDSWRRLRALCDKALAGLGCKLTGKEAAKEAARRG